MAELVSHQKTCDSRAECWLLIIINKSKVEVGRKRDLPVVQPVNTILDYTYRKI